MIETYNQLVDIMISGDDASLDEFMLLESHHDDALYYLGGNSTFMNYLFLFENFLDDNDLYLFNGWDTAVVIGKPVIEKFWVTIVVKVDANTDMRGADRIEHAVEQCEIKTKKTDDGGILVSFSLLKRDLDKIEDDNTKKIDDLSDQEMDKV